jgi:hypothetical protein
MARWTLLAALVLLAAPSAAGHPAFLPIDPPAALVEADPGGTTFVLSLEPTGWLATISRSLTNLCDIALAVGSRDPLDLRARVLIPVPSPLRVEIEAGATHIALMAALWLSPMRLVGTRSWGSGVPLRFAAYASDSCLVATVGVEIDERWKPFVGATRRLESAPLWTVTLTVRTDGLRLGVGGTW